VDTAHWKIEGSEGTHAEVFPMATLIRASYEDRLTIPTLRSGLMLCEEISAEPCGEIP
jgi:hypothetical protein